MAKPQYVMPDIADLLTANPSSAEEDARAIEDQEVELLTFQSAKAELEDASVRAVMSILSGGASPKDKISAINTTKDLIAIEGRPEQKTQFIAGKNVQVNQITNPDVTRHLLSVGKEIETLEHCETNDIKQAQGGRG